MRNNLKIVFFGTTEYTIVVLDELKRAGIIPTLIVTTPDKPKGRKLISTPPPIKIWAEKESIDVVQPEQLTDKTFLEELQNTNWDLFIVVFYGKILPKKILEIPQHGVLNVHPSLLPKFRGPSPVQTAILEDERKNGISIILLDEEMDHGPIVAQARIEIDGWPPKENILSGILALEGGKLLAEVIPQWVAGHITSEEQDHKSATYTDIIKKEDGLIDFNDAPYENYRKIQAYDTWPGTYFFTKRNGKKIRIKIIDASFSDGVLTIEKIIPEGKKEMKYEDFLRG